MSHKFFFTLRRLVVNMGYFLTSQFDKRFISVLCFHSISEMPDRYSISSKSFHQIIEKISSHSDIVSIDEAFSDHMRHRSSVVITFDDGYKDILKLIPTFRKYTIQPLVFVLSDSEHVDRSELANSGKLLNWKELKMLVKNGVQIGCHTATHPYLANLSDAELKREIVDSKKTLEAKLGVSISYFAYPKGVYNSRIQKFVRKAGYKGAFSIDPGCITPLSDKWALPRTIIDKTHTIDEIPAVYYPSTFRIRKLTNSLHIWERFLSI